MLRFDRERGLWYLIDLKGFRYYLEPNEVGRLIDKLFEIKDFRELTRIVMKPTVLEQKLLSKYIFEIQRLDYIKNSNDYIWGERLNLFYDDKFIIQLKGIYSNEVDDYFVFNTI